MKKFLILILSLIFVFTSCEPEEETVGMDSFNNPKGIITSLESQDEKPKVKRELIFKDNDREIEDNYIFEEDFKGKLFYPMIISYRNLNTEIDKFRPTINIGEKLIDYKLIFGKSLGELSNVYGGEFLEKEIRDTLSDSSTFENALNPNLPENLNINVVKLSDIPYENDFEGEAPHLTLTFEDENFLFSYGFNSFEGFNGEIPTVSIGKSLPYENSNFKDEIAYIAFYGDIPELELKAYDSGNKNKEITGVNPKIEFYESNLYEFTKFLTEEFLIGNFYSEELEEEMESFSKRILIEHLAEITNKESFSFSIEDLISTVDHNSRVFYIPIDIDIKSGERISIKRFIPSSHNFEGVNDTDFEGYHIIGNSNFSIDYENTEVKFEEPLFNDLRYIEIYKDKNPEDKKTIESDFENKYVLDKKENLTFTFNIR